MVRYTDKIVGQLVNALKQNDLLENTMIVFTTDNGTTRSISGTYKGELVQGGKASTKESGICEPFIVSWPSQIKAGRESEALVDFTDMLPTFLDIAGVGEKDKWTKSNAAHTIDGKSFKDVLLMGDEASKRDWILGMGGGNNARLTEDGVENQYKFRDRVIRNEQYKLYVDSNREAIKFFDLRTDPFERQNIIDNLSTEEQKNNFNSLLEVIKSFPVKDYDPKYKNNPPQDWDVEITAESEKWKI